MADELLKGDAIFDQSHAEIRDAVLEDIPAWAEFSLRINAAANTREECVRAEFIRDERYRIMRLADLASKFITARLLDRDV